jgi:hypothetical protein
VKRDEMLRVVANTIYNNSMRSSMLETLPLAEKVLAEVEKYMFPALVPDTKVTDAGYCPNCLGFLYKEDIERFCRWEPNDGKLDPFDPTIWRPNDSK